MAFDRPTLAEIYARTKADLVALSESASALLPRSPEEVITRIVSRVAHGLHGHVAWAVLQILPDTADIAQLRRFGGVFGITEAPATFSTGTYTFTGTNTTAIAAGTEIDIDGQLYTTDAIGTISGGDVDIAVTASTAGDAGNALAGVAGTLTGPISGVDTEGVVASGGLTGGADAETAAAYRARILLRTGTPPRGGNEADFQSWISATAGVSVYKSWIYAEGDGPGTVAAAFVVTDSTTGTGFDLADAGEITLVQAAVDAAKPVFMNEFRAYTPTGETMNLTIDMETVSGADTATVRAAVEANIKEMFGILAAPEGTITLSQISEAISTTTGEQSHEIDSPATDPTAGTGAIFDDVSITWA